MDKIRYRDLQRWKIEDILEVLPVVVTRDSQSVMVILTPKEYDKLQKKVVYRHDSQVSVPELDVDGNVIWGGIDVVSIL